MAQKLAPAIAEDRSKRLVKCAWAGCDVMVEEGQSFSILIAMGTTGPAHAETGLMIPGYGCPGENHFCCSIEHAALAGHACIDEHVLPMHAAKHEFLSQAYLHQQEANKKKPRKKAT